MRSVKRKVIKPWLLYWLHWVLDYLNSFYCQISNTRLVQGSVDFWSFSYFYFISAFSTLYLFSVFLKNWSTVNVQYWVSYKCTVQWFTIFKCYTSFILNIKYSLYFPCCTLYLCSLFYNGLRILILTTTLPLHLPSPYW